MFYGELYFKHPNYCVFTKFEWKLYILGRVPLHGLIDDSTVAQKGQKKVPVFVRISHQVRNDSTRNLCNKNALIFLKKSHQITFLRSIKVCYFSEGLCILSLRHFQTRQKYKYKKLNYLG